MYQVTVNFDVKMSGYYRKKTQKYLFLHVLRAECINVFHLATHW